MTLPKREYSTGLDVLDRFIGGGLKAGVLTALRAPAGSQSERLLAEIMAEHRTVFVSTTRPEWEVRDWIERTVPVRRNLTVHAPAVDSLLAEPLDVLDSIPRESLLVIDPINALEDGSRERYLSFLNTIKERLRETTSVGIVHCLESEHPPSNRELTLKRADQVWELEVLARSREIKTRLLITKARRGLVFDRPIPLVLSDTVRIDHSRNI
ncbi:RAD55 family ATPase [Halopiger djelfimassiliensis]|uniref:RAD55 family ATPase n=1 Tax=Halopiger djelfimassiliensis TaxID=1293047 RepID=UPI0012B60527|nr:transcriptional regulator [Halopiger djelfimassiliensis]